MAAELSAGNIPVDITVPVDIFEIGDLVIEGGAVVNN